MRKSPLIILSPIQLKATIHTAFSVLCRNLLDTININSAQVTSAGSDTFFIDPATNFTASKWHYVQIDAGAFKDTSNNDFAGITDKTYWNFGVKDNTPPTIVKVYPLDGATAVPTNANLIIVFSEAVNAGSIGSIKVYNNDNVLKDTIDVVADIDEIKVTKSWGLLAE